MDGAKLKALKQVFPELRNLEGRFFHLFLTELQGEIEDWAIWARLQLQRKKCYNIYRSDVPCVKCEHLTGAEFEVGCAKFPELGQTWSRGQEQGELRHGNTGEWYWCIKECPDFAEKGE